MGSTKVAHTLGDSRVRSDLKRVDLPKRPIGSTVSIINTQSADELLDVTARQIEIIKVAVTEYLGLDKDELEKTRVH